MFRGRRKKRATSNDPWFSPAGLNRCGNITGSYAPHMMVSASYSTTAYNTGVMGLTGPSGCTGTYGTTGTANVRKSKAVYTSGACVNTSGVSAQIHLKHQTQYVSLSSLNN